MATGMARHLNKLSALAVERLKEPDRYSDGGGLYLRIWNDDRRYWTFMYMRDGRQREIGLGTASRGGMTLAEARTAAALHRAALREGRDPLECKRAAQDAAAQEKLAIPSFGEFADAYIETMRPSWRNAKHAAQWTMTLREYAAPIRGKAIDRIDTDDVLVVLKPIWLSRHETARRFRGRIENILDAAKAKGFRTIENPARWRGHLKNLLPRSQAPRGHFAALPFEEIPAFMEALRKRPEVAARALELTVLTAARTTESSKARRSELDLDKAIWTIPSGRMKAKREHRVPLSDRALQVLRGLPSSDTGVFIFPGRNAHGLSDMAMTNVLKRMGYDHVTVHGFRSTFRDWAAETTNFPNEVCEMALAHNIKDRSEAAYRRGDLLDKRRALMQRWSEYCESGESNIVAFPARAAG